MRYEDLPPPWDHQGEGVSVFLGGSGALWWDPRVGKTRPTGEALRFYDGMGMAEQVIVVGPINAKGVWGQALPTFLPHWPLERCEGLQPRPLASSTRAVVVNPDILEPQRGRKGWAGELIAWMGQRPTVLVIDEAHKYAANPRTGAYKALERMSLCAKAVWELTGTPYETNAMELHYQLRLLGTRYPHYWTKWTDFGNRFCERKFNAFRGQLQKGRRKDGTEYEYRKGGYDYSGLRNEEELVASLEGVVHRAKRADCLDIPDVRWLDVWVDHFDQQVQLNKSEMMKLRGELTLLKVQRTVEYVAELPERPVIVYGYHRAFVRSVANHFDAPVIYGDTTGPQRDRIRDEFMEGKHPVLVANLALDAIDLSLSCDVVYGELDWSATKLRQSSDRMVNGMDKREKRSHVLLVAGSVEEEVWNRILLKGEAMERLDKAARALRDLGLSMAELG